MMGVILVIAGLEKWAGGIGSRRRRVLGPSSLRARWSADCLSWPDYARSGSRYGS